MSAETQDWYVLENGQQVGPFSPEQLAAAVAAGSVVAESQVWTEGLEGWIPAAKVGGLFAEAAPAVAAPAPAAPAEYPRVGVMSASFQMIAGFVVGGIGLFLLALFVSSKLVDRPDLSDQLVILMPFMFGLAALCWVVAGVMQLIYVHRAWKCLQFGNPRTTPGKAAWLLLVPVFSYYWAFVAWHGWSRDWNRVIHEFPDLRHGPVMPEGKFLAFCICAVVFPPAALVLWFPVMGAMCRAISFMAFRPVHHLGGITLG